MYTSIYIYAYICTSVFVSIDLPTPQTLQLESIAIPVFQEAIDAVIRDDRET